MRKIMIPAITLLFVLLTATASAQPAIQYTLAWSTVSGSGSLSSGTREAGSGLLPHYYSLESIVAQPAAEITGKANYTITSGVLAAPPTATTLVLLYVNANNNLDTYIRTRLLPKVLKGATNPNVVTMMVLDGPDKQDSHLYRLGTTDAEKSQQLPCHGDLIADPHCDTVFTEGVTVWPFNENIADPDVLSDFVAGQMNAFNAQRVVLAMVGHGGGWAPSVLANQPQSHGGKPANELGGLLWDDYGFVNAVDNQAGNSLSTPQLGAALSKVYERTGRKIDLLYLDACLMGMWEVGYEVRDAVHYLLASESWSWTSFAYDAHLSRIDATQSAEVIGKRWIQNEIPELGNYPFTYSLIDLSQMQSLASAISTLGSELSKTLPASKPTIAASVRTSACFDSNDDHEINRDNPAQGKGIDNYCDLGSVALNLQNAFSNTAAIANAAISVQTILSNTLASQEFRCGVPLGYSSNPWCWQKLSGVSIYVPIGQDEWKRGFYGWMPSSKDTLQSSRDTQWDDFLNAYWNVTAPATPTCADPCTLPEGPLSTTGSDSPFNQIFLPIVQR